MNFASDDFFSPIRHVTTDSDSSVDSENCSNLPSSNMTFTFSKSFQKESVIKHNKIKGDKETDKLRSCSSESTFVLKPETPNISIPLSKSSNKSKRSSKIQLDTKATSKNEKHLKNNVTNKEISPNSPDQSKQQGCEQSKSKDAADYDPAKLNSKHVKKSGSRPTSLSLSAKEGSKGDTIKSFKKERSVAESSKNSTDLNMLISNAKHSEKKLIDNSRKAAHKISEISNEKSIDSNSSKSLICNSSNSKSDASSRKSGIVLNVQNSDSTSNMPVTPFEMSVEKIVHDLISSECEKIRQNMYAQQMSIYRELNKVKEEMKRQHSADTERMLQVIQNLAQMNISLKSMPQHKS